MVKRMSEGGGPTYGELSEEERKKWLEQACQKAIESSEERMHLIVGSGEELKLPMPNLGYQELACVKETNEVSEALLEEVTAIRRLLRDAVDEVATIRRWIVFWAWVLFLIVFGPLLLVLMAILAGGGIGALSRIF